MARGKNAAKKHATDGLSAQMGGGAARPVARAGPVAAPPEVVAVPQPGRSAGRSEPLLGIAVMSPWGWRILAVFTLVALGLCLTFFLDGHAVYGALWVIVAAGWATFTYRLWRSHLAWDRP